MSLGVIKDLCLDVLLGLDFQTKHKNVVFEFRGPGMPLKIPFYPKYCALAAAKVVEPKLFANLLPGCQPIATKSRYFNKADQEFISCEINRLIQEDIIEQSDSPWRAQIVIAKDENDHHKKRLCIDYSNTINLSIQLDAYP